MAKRGNHPGVGRRCAHGPPGIMFMACIESGICTGSNHAWNYVKVDGKYYWLDVTWDDLDSHATGYQAEHTYFLVNSDMLLRSRNIDCTQ